MRKCAVIILFALAMLTAGALSCSARGHGHGHRHHEHFSGSIWIGPGWGTAWPGPIYPLYYPSGIPRTVVQPRYDQDVQAPSPEEEDYWYYCREPEGYYPYIKNCPGGWMKVVPPPEAPEEED